MRAAAKVGVGLSAYLPRISAAQVLALSGVALQMTPMARARDERAVCRIICVGLGDYARRGGGGGRSCGAGGVAIVTEQEMMVSVSSASVRVDQLSICSRLAVEVHPK